MVFALAVSRVAKLAGLLVKDPERVGLYFSIAVFPVVFVSNVFIPAAAMPGWL